jgi:hypothetical protein
MNLTGKEIYQIQFLLPIQGDLKILESAARILNKLNTEEEDADSEQVREIDLSIEEIIFLKEMIKVLDEAKKLNIHGLSLYNKILNTKE